MTRPGTPIRSLKVAAMFAAILSLSFPVIVRSPGRSCAPSSE